MPSLAPTPSLTSSGGRGSRASVSPVRGLYLRVVGRRSERVILSSRRQERRQHLGCGGEASTATPAYKSTLKTLAFLDGCLWIPGHDNITL